MTYQEKKQQLLFRLQQEGVRTEIINTISEGMKKAEELLEDRVRELLEPYADTVQKLRIASDTKKESKRQELVMGLSSPKNTRNLDEQLKLLINVVRL